jgi:uncharacterized protein YecE (DUF72 family)
MLINSQPRRRREIAGSRALAPAVTASWRRYVGSAGWNVPRLHRDRFAVGGSQLQRYASRLNAAEINSSFYRPHAPATYQRWAASVPPDFRFAVKIPKLITHDRALTRARDPLARFLGEITALGPKLGPLLVQLPPSFAYESRRVGRFFELLRSRHAGPVVCEPRHATWTSPSASRAFEAFRIARVAADPPRAAGLEAPGGWGGIVYYRWHGSPRAYFSPYSDADIDRLAQAVQTQSVETWCIFDNTGSGSAAGNALDLTARLEPNRSSPAAVTSASPGDLRVSGLAPDERRAR